MTKARALCRLHCAAATRWRQRRGGGVHGVGADIVLASRECGRAERACRCTLSEPQAHVSGSLVNIDALARPLLASSARRSYLCHSITWHFPTRQPMYWQVGSVAERSELVDAHSANPKLTSAADVLASRVWQTERACRCTLSEPQAHVSGSLVNIDPWPAPCLPHRLVAYLCHSITWHFPTRQPMYWQVVSVAERSELVDAHSANPKLTSAGL
ncbi:hypothetical protein J6590_061208 [Homalodisca vitripennis]|nr:hypothetical protein J6590_061208 [Homalodisca vitripennis]